MSKTTEEKIVGIAWLFLFLALEPVKRVLSAVLYPVAYALRGLARDTGLLKGVLWPEYLYYPAFIPVWLFLDDSAAMEFGKEYADKPKYYPAWVWGLGSDFLKAYWWAAIRNSCVNWNNWCAFKLGEMEFEPDHIGERNFLIVRRFKSGAYRPYCEFYLFGKWNQVGWISGKNNGAARFEIDVMKERK